MQKKEKFEPQDSNQRHRKSNQVVESDTHRGDDREESKTNSPAMKRQFSEQPPTKRNSKT